MIRTNWYLLGLALMAVAGLVVAVVAMTQERAVRREAPCSAYRDAPSRDVPLRCLPGYKEQKP